MRANTNESSTMEGEYPGLSELIYSYLKSERPIDDVLKHATFQRLASKMSADIVGNADRGWDVFQSLCAQILRRDREGPPARPNAKRPQGLRAAGLHTPDEFWAYLYESARNLARSRWRKTNRRQKKAPTYHLTADDLARVKAGGVSAEARQRLLEALELVGAISEKHLFVFFSYLRGNTTRETASSLGCSHVSVQKLLRDALSEVRGQGGGSLRKAS